MEFPRLKKKLRTVLSSIHLVTDVPKKIRDNLIAILRPVHVGPKQSPKGVTSGQVVAGCNSERSAGGQVNSIKVTHKRNVGRRRAEGNLLRKPPIWVTWFA